MSIARKALSLAVVAVCGLSGCIPYAYPNLMSVPAVRLDATPEPIHAFRVEAKGQTNALGGTTEEYVLSRIENGLVEIEPMLARRLSAWVDGNDEGE